MGKCRRFDEKRSAFYATELVLGLQFLHERGYIHRDIKPENVMLTMDGHTKLTDFGMCKKGILGKKNWHILWHPKCYGPGNTTLQEVWRLGGLVGSWNPGLPNAGGKSTLSSSRGRGFQEDQE